MGISKIAIRRAVVSDAGALSKFMNTIADEKLDTIGGLRPTPEEEVEFIEKAEKTGAHFF